MPYRPLLVLLLPVLPHKIIKHLKEYYKKEIESFQNMG